MIFPRIQSVNFLIVFEDLLCLLCINVLSHFEGSIYVLIHLDSLYFPYFLLLIVVIYLGLIMVFNDLLLHIKIGQLLKLIQAHLVLSLLHVVYLYLSVMILGTSYSLIVCIEQ